MKTTVYVVEDDQALNDCICRLLRLHGYVAVGFPSAIEVISALDVVPDAVLLDLMLPSVDGEAVLAEIRQRRIRTRVIITTAIVPGERIDDLKIEPPDMILHKPIELHLLLDAIGPAR